MCLCTVTETLRNLGNLLLHVYYYCYLSRVVDVLVGQDTRDNSIRKRPEFGRDNLQIKILNFLFAMCLWDILIPRSQRLKIVRVVKQKHHHYLIHNYSL